MKYFVGIILIGIGFVIIWKSDWLMNNLGRIDWAEQHLGMDGGTRLLYKLIGVVLIIGAFLLMGGGLSKGAKKVFTPSGPTDIEQPQSEGL
ncbi:MAG: hypothetical protein WCT08_06390 [Patescibacteria group bacterium]|jgi:hypothetical protein